MQLCPKTNAPRELVGRRGAGDEGALVVAVQVDLLGEVLVGDDRSLDLLRNRGARVKISRIIVNCHCKDVQTMDNFKSLKVAFWSPVVRSIDVGTF